MLQLQTLIHHLEEGKGINHFKGAAALLVFCFAALLYDHRCYQNFHTQEAMEVAQLARNLADGEGYTTKMVRPFDIYLVQKHSPATPLPLTSGHPDLANPPLYPLLLSGLIRGGRLIANLPIVGGVNFDFTLNTERFIRYQPEVLITAFNQVLFLGSVLLVFFLGRRLFDSGVGWLAAVVFAGTEFFWRASTSGLAIHLLIFLFLGLAHFLVSLQEKVTNEEEPVSAWKIGLLVLGAALLAGALFMTRYGLGSCVAIATFLWLLAGRSRKWALNAGLFAAVFLIVIAPWLWRNHTWTGHWFGTAGFALEQSTGPNSSFPGNTLERSLEPEALLKTIGYKQWVRKWVFNGRDLLQHQLPNFSGSWMSAFFLISLFVPFRNPTLHRFRLFLVLLIGLACIFQPLGRTHLWDDNPWINSENLLLVLGVPSFIFGAAVFFTLMEQFEWFLLRFRLVACSAFAVFCLLPLVAILLPPRTFPVVYPPYNPPIINRISGWMEKKELIMSDMPWAVAWYGNRSCLWLTLNSKKDFFAVNDYREPIRALYLTPITLGLSLRPMLMEENEEKRGEEGRWGWFVLHGAVLNELPRGFPLKKAPARFLPEQLFLTDHERWLTPQSSKGTN